MKELSIEEKAKRYDYALTKARNIVNSINVELIGKDSFEAVFPELKESEDEKIRKQLLKHLREVASGKSLELSTTDYERWATWVAKQGSITKLSDEEQNKFAKGVLTSCALSFIDYLDAHKYEDKMCVSNGECEDIQNAFHNAMWDRLHRYYCKYIEKQGEQNPAEYNRETSIDLRDIVDNEANAIWEEESTDGCHLVIDSFNMFYGICMQIAEAVVDYKKPALSEEDKKNLEKTIWFTEEGGKLIFAKTDKLVSWLKSLRPQNTWKPSDEQMKGIECTIKTLKYQLNVGDNRLNSLYNDLKKLREELLWHLKSVTS